MKKILVKMGGFCPAPVIFNIVNVLIETKFGTVIKLCIFYPKNKELILLLNANEFYDVIRLFSS